MNDDKSLKVLCNRISNDPVYSVLAILFNQRVCYSVYLPFLLMQICASEKKHGFHQVDAWFTTHTARTHIHTHICIYKMINGNIIRSPYAPAIKTSSGGCGVVCVCVVGGHNAQRRVRNGKTNPIRHEKVLLVPEVLRNGIQGKLLNRILWFRAMLLRWSSGCINSDISHQTWSHHTGSLSIARSISRWHCWLTNP